MCGISGYYFSQDLLENFRPNLEEACKILNHRGPDDNGIYYALNYSLGISHNRLSIIDNSFSGHQPMISDDGSFVLSFNGEIYNFKEIKSYLNKNIKIKWKSKSDTEVLLNLYIYYFKKRKNPKSFLKKLNGIFSIAIWNKNNKTLLLARDAYGVKPLYYFLNKKGIAFASEIKALKKLIPEESSKDSESNKLDLDSIDRYLTFLYCPGTGTPNKYIKKLAPGEALIIKDDFISKSLKWYVQPVFNKTSNINERKKDAFYKTELLLKEAVRKQMVSDVPLGAFLSGGLDSSSIVHFAKEINPNIACFTIDVKNNSDEGFEADLPFARKTANFLKVPLNIISVDPILLIKSIEQMIWHLDEPLADPAALNVFFISQLARESGIKVLLSGAGGDDIFTGYRRHLALQYEYLWEWLPIQLRKKIKFYTNKINANNFIGRRIKKTFSGANLNQADRLVNYFKWIQRDDLRKLYSEDLKQRSLDFDEGKVMKDFLYKLPSNLHKIDKILALEQRYFLCDHNLNYTDKMSMLAGVEVRVPFLDHKLVEYVTNLSPRYKQKYGQSKWILKKIMEKHLPKEIIYRSKSGFGVPLRSWLKNELYDWIMDILSEKRIKDRGIFNAKAIGNLIEENRSGEVDATYTIFSLACIEVWCDKFL